MPASLFVWTDGPGDGRGEALSDGLRRAGRDVVAVEWRAAEYALARQGDDVSLHMASAGQLGGAWALLVLSANAPLLAEVIDYCRSKEMHVAVLLQGEALAAHDLQQAALADLVLAGSKEAGEAVERLWADQLHLPISELPQIRVVSSAANVGAAIERWNPLRRVWVYIESTIRTPYNSGIQRLARTLGRGLQELGIDVVPVAWDTQAEGLKPITRAEAAHLAKWNGPVPREGRAPALHRGDWLIVPEITLPPGPSADAVMAAARRAGLRVAFVFFDLIPLKLSPLWPGRAPPIYEASVARLYEAFWRQMAFADAILPISRAAGDDLVVWLCKSVFKQNGLDRRIVTAEIAGEFPERPRQTGPVSRTGDVFTILSVGTVEPRKNHLRLIQAFGEAAGRAGAPAMRLVIAGSQRSHPDYVAAVKQAADEAKARGCGIAFVEDADDFALAELYRTADLIAYASYEEGFGLPILESAWFGVPCLCHNDGAIRDTASGGGAEMVDMLDIPAMADAIARLASDRDAVARLAQEARTRPIKTWADYAREIALILGGLGAPAEEAIRALPAFRPQVPGASGRPLLSICITTYNRAAWLSHTLPRLLALVAPYRDVVEIVVCDNASTDETPAVIARAGEAGAFVHRRNDVNVGMLGNLGVAARLAEGEFVWLLGDDDILVAGAIEDVLEGLVEHPDAEMIYLNYAVTRFDHPTRLTDIGALIASATSVAQGGPNRRVERLREVATINDNLFTAIYACVLRRDHAMMAYTVNVSGPPFGSLVTCVPSADYIMRMMIDRPAYWIGSPTLVVNLNVSWRRWELLWRLERIPELYDWAEHIGLGGPRLDFYRWKNVSDSAELLHDLYFKADENVRECFDLRRFILRALHLDAFRTSLIPRIRHIYEEAASDGRLKPSDPPADRLFSEFGL